MIKFIFCKYQSILWFPSWIESSPTLAEVSANHIRQSSPNAICLCSWVHGAAPHGNIDLSGPFRVVGVCVGLHRRAIVAAHWTVRNNTCGTCILCHSVPNYSPCHMVQFTIPCAIGVVHMWRTTYGSLRMALIWHKGAATATVIHRIPPPCWFATLMLIFTPTSVSTDRASVSEGIDKGV